MRNDAGDLAMLELPRKSTVDTLQVSDEHLLGFGDLIVLHRRNGTSGEIGTENP